MPHRCVGVGGKGSGRKRGSKTTHKFCPNGPLSGVIRTMYIRQCVLGRYEYVKIGKYCTGCKRVELDDSLI